MRRALVDTVTQIMRDDSRVVTVLGDIGVFGFRNTSEEFPNRVYNIGILEQATVSMAAGLASQGLIPVVHTIAPFLVERALEQIKVDFGYQDLPGNLVSVGGSVDYGALGGTHHCPGDIGIRLNIPGIEIYIPGTAQEFSTLFHDNYDNNKASYFRLSESSNRDTQTVKSGKINVLRTGNEATVICFGPSLDMTLEACQGMDVTILYATSLRPFDELCLKEEYLNGRYLLVEPFYEGTAVSAITHALPNKPLLIRSVGIPREFIREYGTTREIYEHVGFSASSINRELESIINC